MRFVLVIHPLTTLTFLSHLGFILGWYPLDTSFPLSHPRKKLLVSDLFSHSAPGKI